QRIHKLLAEMDRQNKRTERLYAPIQEFVEILNKFFRDSKKTASVDSLGRLNITQGGSPIQLSAMSSGEKQLLILLAHGRFARNQQGVVIVDEPEISLHLRWQEMLIDSISPEESENQFIFATHSPEIVGFRKNNCVQVG
ncbi:AAA family ATPase, partial [Achromobacter dolens]